MGKKPSTQERFEEFARNENAKAVRGTLFRRALGDTGSTDVAATRQTLRDLLSDALLPAIQDIMEIDPDKIDSLRQAIQETADRAMNAADDIVTKEDPNTISMLDATTLGRTTDQEIDQFLRSLKRDPSNEKHAEFIIQIMQEAIDYFDRNVGRSSQTVHANLRKRSMVGVHTLFKVAAGQDRKLLVPQACGLLRIMAVINFIKTDPKLSLIPNANRALDDFANKHIKTKTKGHGFIFQTGHPGDEAVNLVEYTTRPKTQDSTVTKLLIKPSNRANEVTDHIGGRFITRTALDVLRLIHKMFFHGNAPLPSINIDVGEGKNKMIDAKALESIIFEGDTEEAEEMFNQLSSEMTQDDDNPYSFGGYTAIHITFDMPIETDDGAILSFPVEFQFLYLEAHTNNGIIAPHEQYKDAQGKEMTRRVLTSNLSDAFQVADSGNR